MQATPSGDLAAGGHNQAVPSLSSFPAALSLSFSLSESLSLSRCSSQGAMAADHRSSSSPERRPTLLPPRSHRSKSHHATRRRPDLLITRAPTQTPLQVPVAMDDLLIARPSPRCSETQVSLICSPSSHLSSPESFPSPLPLPSPSLERSSPSSTPLLPPASPLSSASSSKNELPCVDPLPCSSGVPATDRTQAQRKAQLRIPLSASLFPPNQAEPMVGSDNVVFVRNRSTTSVCLLHGIVLLPCGISDDATRLKEELDEDLVLYVVPFPVDQ